MPAAGVPAQVALLKMYYAATVIFVVLDYFLHINIRLAALDQAPAWRALYYVFCLACLALIVWRPGWSGWVAATESLLTLSLLIINMALRVTIVSDDMIESGRGAVTFSEIVNFMLAAGAAYLAYLQSAASLWRSGGP